MEAKKTWKWSVAVSVFLGSVAARAEQPNADVTLVANAVGLARGAAQVELRGPINRKIQWVAGLDASASRFDFVDSVIDYDHSSKWSAALEGGVNVYVWGSAPEGLWIGPRVSVGRAALAEDSAQSASDAVLGLLTYYDRQDESGWTGSLSVLAGFTHVFSSGLTVEAALGPEAKIAQTAQGVGVSGGAHPGPGGWDWASGKASAFGMKTWVGLGWTL